MSSLLPPNATPQERALEEAVSRISQVPVRVRDVWDADSIPLPLLPWLAWAYSVDQWDSRWTEDQKRETVKTALAVQKVKGTIGAVKKALGALGIDVEVQEWFQRTPKGQPYTFRVFVRTGEKRASKEALLKALDLIDANKSLRSHLEKVFVETVSVGTVYAATVAHIGSMITVANFTNQSIFINELAIVFGAPKNGA